MTRSKIKLLLNAEPFGFGPTAAIASFFPYLRERFETIGYIGEGHTLDLQRNLLYDNIHDISQFSQETQEEKTQEILQQYDLVFSALDFSFAKEVIKAGKEIIFYDPLMWYWKSVPKIAKEMNVYLAQDFFGVKEKIQLNQDVLEKAEIVSPLLSKNSQRSAIQKNKHVLINLGGLTNPLMKQEDVHAYVQLIVHSIQQCLPTDEKVIIATSQGIVHSLNSSIAKTYPKSEMEELIASSKYAFMTPGLGNIYDAAQGNIPVIWLPPANDSQGQQLHMLSKQSMVDGSLDWNAFSKININYFQEQNIVISKITQAIKEVLSNQDAQQALQKIITTSIKKIQIKNKSSLPQIIDLFGYGGDVQVAEKIITYAKHMEKKL